MKPEDHERRRLDSDEIEGLVQRVVRERVPADEIELRESDAGKAGKLRRAVRKRLLVLAGYATEKQQEKITREDPETSKETAKPLEDKTDADYATFIDGLRLTMEQKENLQNIVAGYEETVATAKELDPNVKVPSKGQVISHILALGVEKLKKIARIMGRPGLVIVPDKSLEEIIVAMDEKPYYEYQDKADLSTRYKWSGRCGKVIVSIIDEAWHAGVVPGQKPNEQRIDQQLHACQKYFRENGMRLIYDREYAVGMQKGLRAYAKAKEKGEGCIILDIYVAGWGPAISTMFNQEIDSDLHEVAIGYFQKVDREKKCRQVVFSSIRKDCKSDSSRGRGAVQVMKIAA